MRPRPRARLRAEWSRRRQTGPRRANERRWADEFLDGNFLFRSLSYFRDYEDKNVREDQNEGNAIFRPEGGLIVAGPLPARQISMLLAIDMAEGRGREGALGLPACQKSMLWRSHVI